MASTDNRNSSQSVSSGSIEELRRENVGREDSIESLVRPKDGDDPDSAHDRPKPGDVPEGSANEPAQGGPGGVDYALRQEKSVRDNALLDEQLKKAKQENQLRTDFFGISVGMAIFVLLCSNSGVLVYLAQTGGEADPTVLVAWLVSVVAEVIVILHIIAKYLFPSPGNN